MQRPFANAAVRFLLVAVLARSVARADDVRTAAGFAAMTPEAIAERASITLAGQVVSVRQTEAILEDSSGGVRLVGIDVARREPAGGAALAPGDEIEVSGRAEPGGYAPVLRVERITVVGNKPLPVPRRCDEESFFEGREEGRLVAVEGIVEDVWREEGELHLQIQAAGRLFAATIPDDVVATIPDLGADARRFVDALVRVAGPVVNEANQRGGIVRPLVRVERDEWFTVVEPPPSPVFRSAMVPIEAVGRILPGVRSGHRVRTFGQVIHADARGALFIQNGHSGIEVWLGRDATGAGQRFVPGDRVEVSGFVDRSRRAVAIRNATATRIDPGPPPAPFVVTPGAILAANRGDGDAGGVDRPGDYAGCLVRFTGELLQSQPRSGIGAILVRSDGVVVNVRADEATVSAAAATEPGSLVELTGVALVAWGRSPSSSADDVPRRLRLILRGPEDFRVVRSPSWWTASRLLAVLGITGAMLATVLAWAATLRRQLGVQKRLLAAEMRSRRDAALEFAATLRERNRLAANLHDTLQQTIGGIGFQLDACESAGGGTSPEAGRHFTVARQMVSHAAKELQGSVWAMRSLPLEGKPFAAALSELVSRVAEGHDVELSVRTEGALADLPEFVSGNVLLLVQEAVHNALKHGMPRRIEVTVRDDTPSGTLLAVVADDGRGFAVGSEDGPSEGHFGIQGMRERAERLGGRLVVTSRPGGGTRVEALVERRDYDAEIGSPPSRRG